MNTKILASLALMALALVAISLESTLARFTDSASSSGNTFSSGTLNLKLSDSNETVLDAVSASLVVTGLRPGGSSTAQPITLSNAGSLPLRYAMTTATAGSAALAAELQLEIRTVGSGCSIFTGTLIYTGALTAAAIGNPAVGSQAGDRAIAASGSDPLCFRVTMLSTAANAVQGATTTITFTFSAEQTANNP